MISQKHIDTLAVLEEQGLDVYEYRVLYHAMRHFGEQGKYERPISEVTEQLLMSESKYRQVIKSLIKKGFMTLVESGGRGLATKNIYKMGETLKQVFGMTVNQ